MNRKMKTYNFNFVGNFKVFGGISLVAFLIACAIIVKNGFNYGIDFAGGTEMQVKFSQDTVSAGDLRKLVDEMGFKNSQVQRFGEDTEFLIRFETPEGASESETNAKLASTISIMTEALNTRFQAAGPEVRRVDSVGPQVGSQLKRNSILAGIYSLLIILIYIAMRFDFKYAPGAVICLFHDSVLVLGILSLFGHEVNIQVLAAVLTLIGYSLNDTIVTFDRIRENELGMRDSNTEKIINTSINEVLVRSVVTVLTTALAVGSLYVFAGGAIKDFAFTMLWGLLFGVYSSIYVASPLILLTEKMRFKKA